MAAKITSCLAAALVYLGTSCVSADDFTERCNNLSRQLQVSVTFEDRHVVTDETRDVEALNGLSGKRAGENHNVYGLTDAKPTFRMSVIPRGVADSHGRFCAIPDISLTLGFSQFTVYLARELRDPCRRNIIWEHEQQHVSRWKSHLRASAQLLTTILRREAVEPRTYVSRDELEAGIRAWSEELVTPWVTRILAIVGDEQRAIDTPDSYAAVANRMRLCRR
jgi:hypothetical protein